MAPMCKGMAEVDALHSDADVEVTPIIIVLILPNTVTPVEGTQSRLKPAAGLQGLA